MCYFWFRSIFNLPSKKNRHAPCHQIEYYLKVAFAFYLLIANWDLIVSVGNWKKGIKVHYLAVSGAVAYDLNNC